MAAGLVAACLAMGLGALLGGFAPLALPISPSLVRRMSAFGSGVLIGAVLGVVLPEGTAFHLRFVPRPVPRCRPARL